MVNYRLIMQLLLGGSSYRAIQTHCGAAHATIAKARTTFGHHQITTTDLLVLDDFLSTPINADTANILFNILSAREGRGSTMVTSQFNPEEWYTSMADKVVAESLLNRLVGGAEAISLDGPNMRLSPTIIR